MWLIVFIFQTFILYFCYVGESDVGKSLSELETKHDIEIQDEFEVLTGIHHYSITRRIESPTDEFYIDGYKNKVS